MSNMFMASERVPDPCALVIFGASGDLTRRKLVPAIWHLAQQGRLPDAFALVGVARRELDDEAFRQQMAEALVESVGAIDQAELNVFLSKLSYMAGSPNDRSTYAELRRRLEQVDVERGTQGNRCFYCSVPPQVYGAIAGQLGAAGLSRENEEGQGWSRLIVEKPFGDDFESARGLNDTLHDTFAEHQIYRIDHYLGKETVQNLLAFRFANPVFESSWNREHIRRVNITVAESLGVGSRAQYYEKAGATRDMVQNHLTQLMCLVAMEPPVAFEAEHIRAEKVKVLKAIDAVVTNEIVYGQYTAGTVDGEEVPGYLEEDGIPDDSITPTFVQAVIGIDSWRWKGVPFVLRTGKRLPERSTKIDVYFRKPPVTFFEHEEGGRGLHGNVLSIVLQPNEGFQLSLDVKRPGEGMKLAHTILDFEYEDAFGELDDAYETLLSDVIEGNQTLFVHSNEVKESWRIWGGVLDCTEAPLQYEAGSDGPVV